MVVTTDTTTEKDALTANIVLPKFFVQFLKEHEHIDLNARPKNIKEAWIKFWYTRNFLFSQVNDWYHRIRKRVTKYLDSLCSANSTLNEQWGISIEAPLDVIDALHQYDWHNPFKAISYLKKVYADLPSPSLMDEQKDILSNAEREAWVREIISNAHEQKATFVVLKARYYQPYAENVEKFNNFVANRHTGTIRIMYIGLAWLCCSIEELPGYLLKDIGKEGFNRKNCTVEYIVD